MPAEERPVITHRRGPPSADAPVPVAAWLLGGVLAILVIMLLRETAWVTGTLALAFFAALALWPVDAWIRARTPRSLRWLGHAAALILMLLVFVLFSLGLTFVAQQVITGLTRYQESLQTLGQRLSQWSNLAGQGGGEGAGASVDRLIELVMSLATTILQSIWSFGGVLTLLFFLVWLMLAETPSFNAKMGVITSRREGATLDSIVSATASRFRRYLAVRTALGIVTAGLYMAWIWWWGLDFVLVWGLLAFLLNFIPTIGSIIAGALPVGLAFLQRDPATAAIIAAGLIVIEQVMGNYVDPKLQGRQLSISPLVVLVALMFWTWVWGLLGAILAVPMTLILIIAFSHSESLRPIALALSNAESLEELEVATSPP